MRTPWSFAIVAALVPLVGIEARARAAAYTPGNELSLRVSNQLVADKGFAATSGSNDLVQAEFSYARAAWILGRAELWAEVGYTVGQRGNHIFGQFDTELLAQQITAGLRIAVPIRGFIVPQLRVGGGLLLGRLQLDGGSAGLGDGGGSAKVSTWSEGGTGYLLGGLAVLLPRSWMQSGQRFGVTGGVVVEGGYALASRLSFTVAPERPSDTVQTPLVGTSLGSLNLGGGVVRVGLLLRF